MGPPGVRRILAPQFAWRRVHPGYRRFLYAGAPWASVPLPTKEDVLKALRECYDPEIPVNIVDLGLIYKLDISPEGRVFVEMTLTAVGCPVSAWMQEQVTDRVRSLPGVTDAQVVITFEPPWSTQKLTPDGKDLLQAMGFPV